MHFDRSLRELPARLHSRGWDRAWALLAEIVCRYFRVEVHGLENVPRRGPVVVIANHSGYAGADAIVLAHLLHRRMGRKTRVLAHSFFFVSRAIRTFFFGFGLREASCKNGLKSLKRGNLLLIFPEGERGNFKSSLKRYHLQPFHTGFLTMALASSAPVVPCLVTGAEESHWNLGSIGFGRLAPKLRIPFPVNLFPLPVKWRIRFLPPMKASRMVESGPDTPSRRQELKNAASAIRHELQRELAREVLARKHVFY